VAEFFCVEESSARDSSPDHALSQNKKIPRLNWCGICLFCPCARVKNMTGRGSGASLMCGVSVMSPRGTKCIFRLSDFMLAFSLKMMLQLRYKLQIDG
jgi:hypothetical protein